MKKYQFGVAVIILCVACAVWVKKGCVHEVSMDAIKPMIEKRQPIDHSNKLLPLPNVSNTAVVSNGVIVVDTRENMPPNAPDYEPYLKELRKAAEQGADTSFTLHVVDQDGKAVVDAEVDVLFPFNGRKGDTISGKTDEQGLFALEKKTTGEPIFSITKEGYYKTSSKFGFLTMGMRCLQNGRWLPWNPTFQITLKEMRKPIPMIVKKAKIILPQKGIDFGYDFIVGDLVEPHGRGIVADIAFQYNSERLRSSDYLDFTKELWIKSIKDGEGLIFKEKDSWCTLNSMQIAPELGYNSELKLRTDRTAVRILEKVEVKEENYLVVRSRVEKNTSGEIVSSNYGKIYGKIDYGSCDKNQNMGEVNLTYYFNPTPNDRNLEFDGKNNLLKELSSRERRVYSP